MDFLEFTKDYWFLITLVGSVLLTAGYMIVFRVNPWDQQRSAKLRRDRVRFHNSVGYRLIEAGHFKQAQNEFEEALKLSAEDQTAITGRYMAELFIALKSPEWDPAIGFAIQQQLSESQEFNRELNLHIIDKYLGDFYVRVSKIDIAKDYYSKALERRPDYPDALYTKGWLSYELGSDIDGMESAFRKMTEVDSRDYRGFHGLGYALYMKAIAETDVAARANIILDAAQQSSSARILVYNQLNIIMDFGEVARSVDPGLSLYYRDYARKVMSDPVLSKLGDNSSLFLAKLLMSEGQVYLDGENTKLAWIEYQTALDYLAMQRIQADPENEKKQKKHMEKARKLDGGKVVHPIYVDQLAILDLLLPAAGSQKI